MNIQKERFIILKKTKFGEADLILNALSIHGEKQSFIARAALKSKKRFGGGVLEPTHFVQFTYKQSNKEGQLNILQEASLIDDFHGLRRSYDHLDFALRTLEYVSKVSQEGDRHSEFLFNLLGHTLKALETAENWELVAVHFYLKFLLQQGVMTPDPWMVPFLKTNISDHKQLSDLADVASEKLLDVETLVQHYLKNATL